jgi:deazaflavin-dependent oxidoreductase (nitroreductase family)
VAYLRPGFFIRRIANPLVGLFGAGTTLAVRGRRSGEWRTVPVNVLELDGDRYLVAPRGETEWVKNLRVAGGGELRRRGRVEPFRVAEEITDPDVRARIIGAYLDRWGRQVKAQFDQLPDPADHPVFRIEPA